MSLKETLTKTRAANIAALATILAGLVYGLVYRDVEIIKALAMFGAGYLFSSMRRQTSAQGD